MAYTIDTIRLSEKQKQQLIRLKRKTGIENWNVLCRWALCLSLAEASVPPVEEIPSDSNVEMSWKVFSGINSEIYNTILKQTYFKQSNDLNHISYNEFFKLHLSRGISFLVKGHQKILI